MSNKKFLQNVGLMILLNVLVKPFGLMIEMFVQNQIGHEIFGLYSGLYALGFVCSVLTDFGINQYLSKEIANSPTQPKDLFSTAFMVKIGISIIYPFIMIGIGILMGYEEAGVRYLFFISIIHAMINLFSFFRAVLQGQQEFKTDALFMNLDKFLFISIVASLLYFGITIEEFIYTRLFTLSISIIAFLFLLNKYGLLHPPKWNFGKTKNLLTKSLPFAFIMILFSMNERIDMIMIERFVHSKILLPFEAGVYSAAYRWVDAINMFLWIILPMFFAKFAHHQTDKKNAENLLSQAVVITGVPLVFLMLCTQFFGQYLFGNLIFDESSSQEQSLMFENFKVLSIYIALNGLIAPLHTLIGAKGNTKALNKAILGSVFINFILNFIFLPHFGSIAAAYTTLGSVFLLGIFCMSYIKLKIQIELPYKKWIGILVSAFATYAIVYFVIDISLYLGFALLGSFFGFLFLLKIVSLQEIKNLRK